MNATTETVSTPGRYRAVAAFAMTDDAKRVVSKALSAAGCTVGRCARGGVIVHKGKGMYRLTDEQGAPPLTLKAVIELISKAPVAGAACLPAGMTGELGAPQLKVSTRADIYAELHAAEVRHDHE